VISLKILPLQYSWIVSAISYWFFWAIIFAEITMWSKKNFACNVYTYFVILIVVSAAAFEKSHMIVKTGDLFLLKLQRRSDAKASPAFSSHEGKLLIKRWTAGKVQHDGTADWKDATEVKPAV
jgi:hypothetical protein